MAAAYKYFRSTHVQTDCLVPHSNVIRNGEIIIVIHCNECLQRYSVLAK